MDGHLPYSYVSKGAVKYGQSSIASQFSGGDSVHSKCDRTDAVVKVVKHKGDLVAVNNRTLFNQKANGKEYVAVVMSGGVRDPAKS